MPREAATGSRQFRLLLINYEFPPLGGGAGNATANIAREMAGLGMDVKVVTAAFSGLPGRERRDGYEIVRVPAIRRRVHASSVVEMISFMLSAMASAPALARRWRPDCSIAFFGLPSGPVSWLLKALYRVPYAISLRGGDVPGFEHPGLDIYHRLTGRITTGLWRGALVVIANSRGLATLARRHCPDVRIAIVPNGVDLDRFSAPEPNGRTGRVRLLFVGRLVRQKGVDVLLSALAQLPPQTRPCATIVGDGPERGALVRQADRTGLADDVTFTGWLDRDALPRLYAGADMLVLPSRDEGMPNVVLEAMASYLPVIATRVAGNEELVEDGGTGLLVPSEDAGALAAAIGRMAADREWAARMGRAGRKRAEAEFSWRAVAQRYIALLERDAGVIGSGRKASA